MRKIRDESGTEDPCDPDFDAPFWGRIPAPKIVSAETEKIRVAGSTTVLPIASRAAERFLAEKKTPVAITVNGGGSGVGIQSAGNGRVEIGMASREITEKEKKAVQQNRSQDIVIGPRCGGLRGFLGNSRVWRACVEP